MVIKSPHIRPGASSGGKIADGVEDAATALRGGTDGVISTARPAQSAAGRQIEQLGGVTPNHPAVKEALTDRALGASFKVLGPLSMAAFIGPAIANGAGRFTGWVGRKTNLKGVENTGQKIRNGVRYLDETTLEDVGKATGAGGVVSKVAQPIFDGAGAVTGRLSKLTGIGRNRVAAHVGRMHQHLDSARELTSIDLNAVHESVRPHLQEMHTIVSSAANTGHIDMPRLSKAHADFHAGIEKLHLGGKDVKAIEKSGATAIGKFEKSVGRAVDHFHTAEGYRNPSQAIKNLPHEIKTSSLRKTAMEGSFIGLSGLSLVATARAFMKNWRDLKQMQQDISGSKPSTMRLLIGNVAGPVAKARSHLLKTFFAREAVETAGLAVNIKQARGGHISPLTIGAQIAGSQAIDGLMGESIVPVYKALDDLHKSGEAIPIEAYVAFIGQASPDIKARGGAASPFAQELAKQYAAEKVAPAKILQEIDDGSLMIRVHKIIEANKPAQTVSHTQRLAGAAAERQVVGQHTEQLNKQATQHGIEGNSPAV